MKKETFCEILGDIDETYVSEARAGMRKEKRSAWRKWAAAAACLCLIVGIGAMMISNPPKMPEDEIALAYDDILIWYVEGDHLANTGIYLPCTAEDVFRAWKEKNNIGDDVLFIEVRIDDNGTSKEYSFEGESYIEYTLGDHFVFNITISKNIENYYDTIDPELLLESLKQTMTDYTRLTLDEYHLFLE